MQKPRRVSNMKAMRRAAHLSWHFAASEVSEMVPYAAQGLPEESTVRRVTDIRRLRKQLPYFLSAESLSAPEQPSAEEVNTTRPAEAWGLVRSNESETCSIRYLTPSPFLHCCSVAPDFPLYPRQTHGPITEVNIQAQAAAKSRR